MQPIEQTITEITGLLQEQGSQDYYGEPVSQLEHMLQCALLAERAGSDNETIIAAFLHDIGHLLPAESAAGYMDGYGRSDHEQLGGDWLRQRGFSEKIVSLVENHVNAKRYLTFKSPAYYERLSEASRKTLEYQGGRMTADEAYAFEHNIQFGGILQVRRWDEQAKVPGLKTPDAQHYIQKCERHLKKRKL
ncbi:HD domain-containing protein [Nibrella saemangeumensis]|uniref:HD domain-containing protein n=1 Tax=Nibrella saemangeumensis TaxID=1084526 RepID=A0ABP8MI82_9BACT